MPGGKQEKKLKHIIDDTAFTFSENERILKVNNNFKKYGETNRSKINLEEKKTMMAIGKSTNVTKPPLRI